MRSGKTLLVLSILSRAGVVALLCVLALLPEYHNLKKAYNHPRLVELSQGKAARILYEKTDAFFSMFGDPEVTAKKQGGMTWSIRLAGVPFTDPVAALSVLTKNHRLEIGFALGLIIPLTLALLFGRVFCAYVCPASLLFFTISRLRKLLAKFFYLPEIALNRGFSWGVLAGGLGAAAWLGHGLWSLILPYFAIGQTIFHGLAYGTLSFALGSVVLFSLLDLVLGKQFTCRYVCPTGRLLGFAGRKSLFSIKRDAPACIDSCQSCVDVCPMKVAPKFDETVDCSMCGECLSICPANCLSIGVRNSTERKEISTRQDRSRVFESASPLLAFIGFFLFLVSPAHAHHFKGLPHYNYFENYPQVPEEEFLGQAGEYEFSLVVYDFQGINRENVEDPDNVRLFLVIFNLRNNEVYSGPLTFEILDRAEVVHTEKHDAAELENLYSMYRDLPDTGRYALRITLHDEGDLVCAIPFTLSSQKVHWGKWIGIALFLFILIAAIGARRARVKMDRKAEALIRAERHRLQPEGTP